MSGEPDCCPSFGALPCDWTTNPVSAPPAEGLRTDLLSALQYLGRIQGWEDGTDPDEQSNWAVYQRTIESIEAALSSLHTGDQGSSAKTPIPGEPDQAGVVGDTLAAIRTDVLALCNGHPSAKIAWPHRALHDIADRLAAINEGDER